MLSIANINNINPQDYDIIYIVMRSIDSIPAEIKYLSNIKWLPELSPSKELFWWYRNTKKAGEWTESCFEKEYVPQFLKEMHSELARHWLNTIYVNEQQNPEKQIVLCCSCTMEKMCHRSILAGLFEGVGISICNEYGRPMRCYEKYYKLYEGVKNA